MLTCRSQSYRSRSRNCFAPLRHRLRNWSRRRRRAQPLGCAQSVVLTPSPPLVAPQLGISQGYVSHATLSPRSLSSPLPPGCQDTPPNCVTSWAFKPATPTLAHNKSPGTLHADSEIAAFTRLASKVRHKTSASNLKPPRMTRDVVLSRRPSTLPSSKPLLSSKPLRSRPRHPPSATSRPPPSRRPALP